ncbi:PCRF domain-containing protein, partial [bacterium]|nr:PCRF domain-containing protein [bacterium]
MFAKLEEVEQRLLDLEAEVSQPGAAANRKRYQEATKELSDLRPVVEAFRIYRDIAAEIEDHRELLSGDDDELKELANDELPGLEKRLATLEKEIHVLLLPK